MKSVVFLCTYANSFLEAISKDDRFSVLAVYVPKLTSSIEQAVKWDDDEQVLFQLEKLKPDYIVIFGWPKLLKSVFVYEFKIINIHPSYLPSWRGPDPIGNILENELYFGGITFHQIDENEDEGVVLYQELFELNKIYTRGQYLQKIQSKKYVNILLNYVLIKCLVLEGRAKRSKVNVRKFEFKRFLSMYFCRSNEFIWMKIFKGDQRVYICLGKFIIRV